MFIPVHFLKKISLDMTLKCNVIEATVQEDERDEQLFEYTQDNNSKMNSTLKFSKKLHIQRTTTTKPHCVSKSSGLPLNHDLP